MSTAWKLIFFHPLSFPRRRSGKPSRPSRNSQWRCCWPCLRIRDDAHLHITNTTKLSKWPLGFQASLCDIISHWSLKHQITVVDFQKISQSIFYMVSSIHQREVTLWLLRWFQERSASGVDICWPLDHSVLFLFFPERSIMNCNKGL